MIIITSLYYLLLAAFAYLTAFWVPQHEKVFKELGAQLPSLTSAVLSLSHVVQTWWFVLALPLLALGLLPLLFVGICRVTAIVSGIVLILALLALCVVVTAAILLPMQEIQRHLPSGAS